MNTSDLIKISRCEMNVSAHASPGSRSRGVAAGFLLAMLAAGPALAGPTGGDVVAGEGTITRDGNLTQIDQASGRLSINWDTFNLNADETVRFVQPSSDSVALNNIFDQNASQIFGTIDANGRVLLINPNGLIFGPTAQVNVAGLVASSLNISTEDFMNGNYTFESTGGSGLVLNQGSLQAAPGGYIALLGNAVANEGLIVADAGTIALGSGNKVALDFDGSGLLYFEVQNEVLDNALGVDSAISNSGSLFADGGQVLLTAKAAQDVYTQAINNEGIIQAQRIDDTGGVIRLSGGSGTVISSGGIDASGGDDSSSGGTVELLGDKVGIAAGATVNADGATGGGTIRVGGDVHGGDGAQTASYAYVGDDAQLSADATGNGDGGTVVVWADEVARVYGDLSATGGADGGDGGFIETSGRSYLDFNGTVNASAANGAAGTWLLDPESITITNAEANITTTPGDPITFAPNVDDTVTTIDVATINTALDGGSNVTVSTTSGGTTTPGDITVDAAIVKSADAGGDGSTLTLDADNDIVVNQSITSTTGVLNVDLQADNAVDINAGITTNGGSFTVNNGATATFDSAGSTIDTSGANDADGGDVLVTVSGQLTAGDIVTSGGADAGDTQGRNAGSVDLTGGAVTVANVTANGSAATTGGNTEGNGGAVTVAATAGNVIVSGGVDSSATGNGGAVGLTATGGNVQLGDNIDSSGGAAGGAIALTGTAVSLANGAGNASTLTSGNADIAIVADSIDLTTGTGTFNAGTGTLTLRPLTPANSIGVCDEGGAANCTGVAATVEYDLADYAITAGTVAIGGAAHGGNITTADLGQGTALGYGLDLQNGGASGSITIGGSYAGLGFNANSGTGGITVDDNATVVIDSGGNAVTFADNVTLAQALQVNTDSTTDGAVDFQGALTASSPNQSLTVTAGTAAVSVGNIGLGPNALSFVNLAGGTVNLGGNITTSGGLGITISGAKNLTSNVTLTTSNDLVNLGTGDIDGANDLVIAAGSGTVTLGNVGQSTALTSLDVTGGTLNLGGDVDTSGTMSLNGNVALGADLALTAANDNIDIVGNVNGAQALTVDAGTGTVSLDNVGQGTALTSLDVTGGTINLGGNIDTDGAAGVTLAGAKNLQTDVTITTTNDNVDIATGGVDGNQSLVVAAGTGTVDVGDVGQATALADVDVTGQTINLSGDVATDGANGIALNGATALQADVLLDTSAGDGDVNVAGALTQSGNRNLVVDAGAGNVDLAGVTIDSLTVSSADALTLAGNVTTAGATGIDLSAASIDIGAGVTLDSTNNGITLATDALTTGAGSAIDAGTGTVALAPSNANSTAEIEVCQGASCTGTPSVVEYDLGGLVTVTANEFQIGRTLHTGDITLQQAAPGFDLSLVNGGTGGITVAGDFNGQGLALDSGSGGISLDANVSTNGGDASFADDVTLGANVAVATANGNATFSGDINGAQTLNVSSGTGDVALNGTGQQGAALAGLTVTSSGTTSLAGQFDVDGNVQISGAKNLAAGVTIDTSGADGDVDLGTGNVTDTGTQDLEITSGAGQITLAGVATGSLTATTSTTINANGTIQVDGNPGIGIDLTGATIALADAISLTSGGQPISLTANTLNDGPTTAINAAGGTVTLAPLDGTNTIDVCNTDGANGCGTGADTEYDLASYGITAGTVQVGGAGQSGDIALASMTLGGGQTYDLALQNGGAASITAGAFNGQGLSLDSGTGGIGLNGNVTTNGGNASFADDVSLGADVAVATGNGNAEFLGNVDGAQSLVVNAGSGDVTLDGVGQTTALTGISVTTTGGVDLGGSISVDGDVTISGTKNLTADVVIDTTGADGNVNLGTGNVTDTGSRDLTITAGAGTVALAGVSVNALDVTTSGTASVGAVDNTGDIGIAADSIALGGALSGNNVSLAAAGAGIALPQVTAGGTLDVNAAGAVTDNGTLDVTGAATFVATGDVTLDEAGSSFGSVAVTAANAAIAEANATNLAGANVTGTLTVTSGGAITDSGTLTVGGATSLNANGGASDITLDQGASTFGSIALTANNASVTEADATNLGASSIGNDLAVQSGGDITDSGTLTVAGDATFATPGNLTLDDAASTFGSLDVSANTASIREADSMNVVNAAINNGLTLNAGGSISGTVQAGSLTTTSVGGTDLSTTVASVTATNSGGGLLSIDNSGALDVGSVSQSGGGDVVVATNGDLTQSGNVTSDGGGINVDATDGSLSMADGTVTSSNGGDIDYGTTGTSAGDVLIGTLQTCADCSNSGSGAVTIVSGGSIFGQPNQPNVTSVSAFLDAVEDIGEDGNDFVFNNMSFTGDAGFGAPIHLEYGGSAFIDAGNRQVTISETSDASKFFNNDTVEGNIAASAQAAALEEDEDVDWAAYSEDITVYEINNEGVKRPDSGESDEFARTDDAGARPVPIASNSDDD